MVASMLRLGAAGIAEIYDLSPTDALVQARTTLISVVQSRQALMELKTLNLRNTMSQVVTGEDEERQQSVKEFVQGHDNLEALLQEEMAMGLSVLSVCLSRAGGHVLTHRERVELRQAFEKIEEERAATASTSA